MINNYKYTEEWQPIETVPFKQKVLLWKSERSIETGEVFSIIKDIARVYLDLDYGDFCAQVYLDIPIDELTHWQPLPQPPKGDL